ncbi:hypothetical protein PMAYCL1PPCAC_17024, partial [Pristionchus mayeri]
LLFMFTDILSLFRLSPHPKMPAPRALILLTNGVEDSEIVVTTDCLRRAGFEVVLGGLSGLDVITCCQKTRLLPDVAVEEAVKTTFDVIIVTGGSGSGETFAQSTKVGEILRSQLAAGRYVATICVGALVLGTHCIQKGSKITSYPMAREKLEQAGYTFSEESVVVDGKLITSRAPGTVFDFALKIVELIVGPKEANDLQNLMLFK